EIVAAVAEDVFAASAVGTRLPADASYARIEAANRLYLVAITRHARILRVLDSLADTREEFRRLRVDLRESFVRRGMEGLVLLQGRGGGLARLRGPEPLRRRRRHPGEVLLETGAGHLPQQLLGDGEGLGCALAQLRHQLVHRRVEPVLSHRAVEEAGLLCPSA